MTNQPDPLASWRRLVEVRRLSSALADRWRERENKRLSEMVDGLRRERLRALVEDRHHDGAKP